MEKANYVRAIRAALGYTGRTQEELAYHIGIRPETLSRRLKDPGELRLKELEKADELIGWSYFMEVKR